MRNGFLNFLVEEKVLPPDRSERFYKTLQCAPEPIGAIAFRYGLITGADIDEVLDEQRHEHRPFGEIAVSKGFLTETQVDVLLFIQQLRGATQTAEALALAGVCPTERLVEHLGRFLCRPQAIAIESR